MIREARLLKKHLKVCEQLSNKKTGDPCSTDSRGCVLKNRLYDLRPGRARQVVAHLLDR